MKFLGFVLLLALLYVCLARPGSLNSPVARQSDTQTPTKSSAKILNDINKITNVQIEKIFYELSNGKESIVLDQIRNDFRNNPLAKKLNVQSSSKAAGLLYSNLNSFEHKTPGVLTRSEFILGTRKQLSLIRAGILDAPTDTCERAAQSVVKCNKGQLTTAIYKMAELAAGTCFYGVNQDLAEGFVAAKTCAQLKSLLFTTSTSTTTPAKPSNAVSVGKRDKLLNQAVAFIGLTVIFVYQFDLFVAFAAFVWGVLGLVMGSAVVIFIFLAAFSALAVILDRLSQHLFHKKLIDE